MLYFYNVCSNFGVLCKRYFNENISDNILKLKKDLTEPDIKIGNKVARMFDQERSMKF
jgi:hypothetical protein